MKKCSSCGHKNIDEAVFCGNCGAKLVSISDASKNNSNIPNISNSSSSSNSSGASSSSNSNSNANTVHDNSSSKYSNTQINGQKTKKRPSGLRLWCCYVPIVLFVLFMVTALIYYGAAESFPIVYGYDYDFLDLDGDGRLSFDEASQLDLRVPKEEVIRCFNDADTNHNGYLKGHEFELFSDNMESYINIHSSSYDSSDSDKFKYSSSYSD